jgi:hypothetical protein
MKTTVDLPDALLRQAQELARVDRTTVKALIEEGLRSVLARRAESGRFVLRDASVGGRGLSREFAGATWDDIRDAAYGDQR